MSYSRVYRRSLLRPLLLLMLIARISPLHPTKTRKSKWWKAAVPHFKTRARYKRQSKVAKQKNSARRSSPKQSKSKMQPCWSCFKTNNNSKTKEKPVSRGQLPKKNANCRKSSECSEQRLKCASKSYQSKHLFIQFSRKRGEKAQGRTGTEMIIFFIKKGNDQEKVYWQTLPAISVLITV